jgi:fatty-acyl-CoA synthase
MGPNPIEHCASAYSYPLLIKHLLHTALIHAPEHEIVYRSQSRYSYRTFRERLGRLANGLTKLGVEPGQTVAVMDWDSHRYLECYFAIPMMGAVLQTVNIRLSHEQILYTLNHAAAETILTHVDFIPVLEAIKDKLTAARTFVVIDDNCERPQTAIRFTAEYEELLAGATSNFAFPDFDENARATTFYTTGTTGLPKGVYFSHRQLVLHTLAVLAGLGTPSSQGRFHRDDVYMPITPMFHVHAWGFPYSATVLGVKQVYPGRYTPDGLLNLFKTEGVTFSHCVPTIMHMVLTCPGARDVDFSGWKVVVGGSALPRALAKMAIDRGIDIFAGYGMSETCPILTLGQIRGPILDGGSDQEIQVRVKAGLPIPLVDLRVVDYEMHDVPKDDEQSGEVVVRAPWLTQGYFKNPEASGQLWAGGYLHTNDIGRIGTDGYLMITDRLKDVIKTGGEWISSLELEDIIAQHHAVSEVAVIGVKDEKWGERPLAVVVSKNGLAAKAGADEIKSHVKAYVEKGMISKFAIPDRVLFVEALEKTSVGKLDKKCMREKYGAIEPVS